MEIKPLTMELEAKPFRPNRGKAIQNTQAGDNVSAAPISLEISDAANAQYKLSKSALLQVEMTTKLSQALKTNGGSGLNAGNYLEDLALAYDQLHKTLNEHSENSNKNGKYLDAAFRHLATIEMARNAAIIGCSITNDPVVIPLHDGVNPFVDSARKQAEIFTDAFMKDYKKNGINALETALSKLSSMPETTSLSHISYNDLKFLTEKSANGLLNNKSDVTNILNEHGLSAYMKSFISRGHQSSYYMIN